MEVPTTTSDVDKLSDTSTETCVDDLPEDFEEPTAQDETPTRDIWRHTDTKGKDSRRPTPGYHSGAIYPDGTRSGPARDLTPEELEGLRAEEDLAKKTNIPKEVRGPAVSMPLNFVE